jgi:integrase
MGRAKREVPTGKLQLKYPKTNFDKSKEYTLNYYYSYNRKTMTKDTGYRVKVGDWNQAGNNGKGAVRPSYGSDYARVNNRLDDFLREIDERLRVYNERHPNGLTPEIVHSILFSEALTRDDEGKDFVEFVKENLRSRLNLNKIKQSRYENGLSSMNVFQEFLRATGRGTYKADSIYLGEISGDLLDAFIAYKRDVKKNAASTINHNLTPILFACEQAWRKKYISDDVYYEIKDKRIAEDASSIGEESKFDGKYLDKEAFAKLLEFYENDTEVRRKEYIEMFLFAFHAGGLRVADVMTLEWKHINFERKEMRKVLIKTLKYQKQRHTVPLTDAALTILRRWQEMARRERFVFDLLGDDIDIANQEVLYKVRNSVDRKINQALHVVGEKIGLPFSLTFHVARHSFAINALNDKDNPLDMYQVSRLLGHSSTDVTEKVYADYTAETLGDKLRTLNFNFIPNFK